MGDLAHEKNSFEISKSISKLTLYQKKRSLFI